MANISSELASPAPSVLSWDIEEASLSIRIHAGAFNRLADNPMSARCSQAGVLLGHEVPGTPGSVIVEDFQPFPTVIAEPGQNVPVIDGGAIEELTRRWKSEAGKLMHVVGCYAVVSPVTENDREYLQQQLISRMPQTSRFALLISGQSDGSVQGVFLVRTTSRPWNAGPVRTIDWEHRHVVRAPIASASAISNIDQVGHPGARQFGLLKPAGLVAAVLVILLFTYLAVSRSQSVPAHEDAPEKPALVAQLNGGAIYINWGQNKPGAIPESGAVQIQDGPWRKDIHLDDVHRPGQIVYTARTDDVQVTLLTDSHGSAATGYVRVLNALSWLSGAAQPPDMNAASERLANRVKGALGAMDYGRQARMPRGEVTRPEPAEPGPDTPSFVADFNGTNRRIVDSILSTAVTEPEQILPNYRITPSLLPSSLLVETPKNTAPPAVPLQGPPAPAPAKVVAASQPRIIQTIPAMPVRRVKPFVRFNEAFQPETVMVGVTIDADGTVADAHEIAPAGRNRELISRALVAAKQWRFRPAQRDGENVSSDFVLEFRFTHDRK